MNLTYKRILFVVLLSILFHHGFYAQGFSNLGDDFDNRSYKLFLRGTYVKPGDDAVYGGKTINASLSMDSYEKTGLRVRYENPTLGDMLLVLGRMLSGKKVLTTSGLEHAYGSGFLGWLQLYENVVTTDKFLLSPGVTIADYIFSIEKFDSQNSHSRVQSEPTGYFFCAGPALMASYSIGSGFWADAYLNYDLAYGKTKYSNPGYTPLPGYPKPHFLTWGLDMNHNSGIFGGIRFNHAIDRGNNNINARRMDITIGYHFKDRN